MTNDIKTPVTNLEEFQAPAGIVNLTHYCLTVTTMVVEPHEHLAGFVPILSPLNIEKIKDKHWKEMVKENELELPWENI